MGGLVLLVMCIVWHVFKFIVADNGHRLAPSMIYFSANMVLICMYLLLKQIAIDRNFHSMHVRAIYYWDCGTKPILSNDTSRYRYTFHQTNRLGRPVSIDLSANILFRKIDLDRPFTTLLFRTIGIGRSFTNLLFRILGIGM